jgi:hypothetical protein
MSPGLGGGGGAARVDDDHVRALALAAEHAVPAIRRVVHPVELADRRVHPDEQEAGALLDVGGERGELVAVELLGHDM